MHTVVQPSPPSIPRWAEETYKKITQLPLHVKTLLCSPPVPARPLSEPEANTFLTVPTWKEGSFLVGDQKKKKGNKKTIVWSQLLLLWCRECISRRNKYFPAVHFLRLVEGTAFEHKLAEGTSPAPFPRSYASNKGQGALSLLLSFPPANIEFPCMLHGFRKARW